MIKFFRKIRQRLLAENRFSRYLAYAIGEILLVVIGILIALWINNSNQERIKQERIEATLEAIQNNIVQDTYFSNWLTDRYIRSHLLYTKIFDDQISLENLSEEEQREIWDASFQVSVYYILTSGYAQLMESLNEVPPEYSRLLTKLNLLYKIRGRTLESMSEENRKIKNNYIDYLKRNQHWAAVDDYRHEVSDAQLEFYRHNPVFKSHVASLHWSVMDIMWAHSLYRQTGMLTYIEINEILGKDESELPKEIRLTSVATNEDAARLSGIYELSSGPDNTSVGRQLEVTSEGKDLYITYAGQEQPRRLLFYHHEKPWFSMVRSSMLLRFETQGENTLSIINGKRALTHWVKK